MQGARNSFGFTLIELVTIIIILSILASFAFPKLMGLTGDANKVVLHSAVGSIKSATKMFQAKARASGTKMTEWITHEGITGRYYQPQATYEYRGGHNSDYRGNPEIFEAAGMKRSEWAYRIYFKVGQGYAIITTPKKVLDMPEPSKAQVEATKCYVDYQTTTTSNTGEPIITFIDSGC